jgi:hypothetical protein
MAFIWSIHTPRGEKFVCGAHVTSLYNIFPPAFITLFVSAKINSNYTKVLVSTSAAFTASKIPL